MANPAELKSPITAEEIQSEELYGVVMQARGEAAPLDSKAIVRKLRAAEDFYESELGIRLRPTRVFSDIHARRHFPVGHGLRADDIDPPFDPVEDLEEPAYDYDPGNWNEQRWGETRLNYAPVVEITRWVYAYPGTNPTFSLPLTWIKGDYKFGRFKIIPGEGQAIALRFNGFIASVATGSRGIPMSIFIDYVTGFGATKSESDRYLLAYHEDLLEGLRLRTLLTLGGIMINTRSGGVSGGSLGLDGMSHSRNFGGKYGAYSGMLELAIAREGEIRRSFKRQNRGVAVGFM